MRYGLAQPLATGLQDMSLSVEAILGPLLVKWHRADDLIPGAVSSWSDRKGNGSFVQAVGASQPIASATSFNGFAGVTSDGINDVLACTRNVALASGSRPWFCVMVKWLSFPADPNLAFVFGFSDTVRTVGLHTGPINGLQPAAPDLMWDVQMADMDHYHGTLDNNAHMVEVAWNAAGNLLTVDGLPYVTSGNDMGALPGNVSASQLFANGSSVNFSNVCVAEYIECSSEPTPYQKQMLRWCLSARYNTPLYAVTVSGHQFVIAGQSNGALLSAFVDYTLWPPSNHVINSYAIGHYADCYGGTSLHVDWDPTVDPHGFVATLLTHIDGDSQRTPQIVLVWWQGENDDGTTYYTDLVAFKAAIESRSGRPDLLWVIVKMNNGSTSPGKDGVRAAEVLFCQTFANSALIDIDDQPAPYDGAHFHPTTYRTVMARIRTAAQNYFNDARW